jgi:anti-sigma B factor antagonist
MDIDVSEIGQVTVVAPQADIDMAVADTVKRRLFELVDQGRIQLVVDLTHVRYIDSSGLGALVAALKHARSARGDMKICAMQNDVRAIFEMTLLTKVLSIHATRQEAVASWG